MNRSTYIAAALASFAFFAPLQAEAARCPQGSIYRPSMNICQSKASAARAGIYKPRVVKASVKQRRKRAPVVKPPSNMRKTQIAAPAPTPPWMQRTPIIDGIEDEALSAPAPFVHPRFGSLIAMPESPAAWAARNASTFGEN